MFAHSLRRTLVLVIALASLVAAAPVVSAAKPQCNDGIDNDGDGATDFGADPGCDNKGDDSEASTSPPPPTGAQCEDGIDNDGDGAIDMADNYCQGPSDDSEAPVMPWVRCDGGPGTVGPLRCVVTGDPQGWVTEQLPPTPPSSLPLPSCSAGGIDNGPSCKPPSSAGLWVAWAAAVADWVVGHG